MTVFIEAAGANGFLRLHVVRRTYPAADLSEDRDWLTADVSLQADSIKSRFTDTVLQSGELAGWEEQLTGSASFVLLGGAEPIVELFIDKQARTCTVTLDQYPGEKPPKRVTLENVDTSKLLQGIRSVLEAFPPQKEEADEA
jgi:hypothetical protein